MSTRGGGEDGDACNLPGGRLQALVHYVIVEPAPKLGVKVQQRPKIA